MPRLPRLLIAGFLCTLAAGGARAATVAAVDVRGLDEAMALNVRVSLSLVDAIGQDISGRRLAYLLREAESETREALEPFGYYSPRITVERTRDGVTTVVGETTAPAAPPAAPTAAASTPTNPPTASVAEPGATAPAATAASETPPPGERRTNTSPVTVTITVELGEPVTVRRSHIAIEGEGGDDKYLRADLGEFRPQSGDVFDHALYEASKTRITRRLAERGYFDADFATRQVAVTRAEHAADIDLVWTSGDRYDMGPMHIVQTPKHIIRDSLIEKLIYWDEGSYYHQGKLDAFRDSLARLDYFAGIDIQPQPENAVDGEVPVEVTLTPAKRSIYTAGLSYGTDSGAGVRFGIERRYLNDRGHKLLSQIDWAEKRKTATVQYRIPAFAWLDGWYTVSTQFYDEQTDYIDTRKIELVGSRSGQVNDRLNAVASLHGLRERWAYVTDDNGGGEVAYNYATFLYPSLRGEYIDADNRLFPRDAFGLTVELRGGLSGLGSDASFLQAWGTARWYQGMGERNRLILRGEAGYTFTNGLVDMPPSLRFFAGGDRSIRGYAFREVGPTLVTGDGKKFALGAKNVLTGSVEFEHYFNESWGAAAFVDSGDAFDDDRPDFHTGVGFGVRWRSPVGPVRLDIAHGLYDPDSQYEIYLNIGADL
ncbi:autotransporter assembly complex family protein [Lysobacter yangpyeongensis]|uniref:Translocation and assembly module subunit TamA n=1 Tax=Lysobacter yangpyeongensis TaxID=346182 RepID=A0ABW0SPY7_9GAMM